MSISNEREPVDELHPEPPDHPIDHETIDWDEAKKQAEEREATLKRVVETVDSAPVIVPSRPVDQPFLDATYTEGPRGPNSPKDSASLSDAVKLDKAADKEALEIKAATAKLVDREVVIPLDELKKAGLKLDRDKDLEDYKTSVLAWGDPETLNKKLRASQEGVARLEKQLDSEVKSSLRMSKSLQKSLDLAEKCIAELESVIRNHEAELEGKDRELLETKNEVSSMKGTIQSRDQSLKLVDEEIDRLKEALRLEEIEGARKLIEIEEKTVLEEELSEMRASQVDLKGLVDGIDNKAKECIREYESLEHSRDRYKTAHEEVIGKLHASETRVDKTLKLMSKLVDAVGTNPAGGDKNGNGNGPEEGTVCRHCGTAKVEGERCSICQKK